MRHAESCQPAGTVVLPLALCMKDDSPGLSLRFKRRAVYGSDCPQTAVRGFSLGFSSSVLMALAWGLVALYCWL